MAEHPLSMQEYLRRELMRMNYFSRHPTGKPYYIENCETTRAWLISQTRTGGLGDFRVDCGTRSPTGDYSYAPSYKPFNGKSMWMLTSPGVNGATMYLINGMVPPQNLRLGFEIFFAFPYSAIELNTRCAFFDFGWALYDGSHVLSCHARYLPLENEVRIYRTTGGREPSVLDVTSIQYSTPEWLIWNSAKLIANFETKRYVKLFWNQQEIDLSNHPIYEVASPTSPRLNNLVEIQDRTPFIQWNMFIGGIILTLEEP